MWMFRSFSKKGVVGCECVDGHGQQAQILMNECQKSEKKTLANESGQ